MTKRSPRPEGLGVVICSPSFVREEVRAGRLVALSDPSLMTGDAYRLILPRGRLSPALRRFADWLVEEAAAEASTQPEGHGRECGASPADRPRITSST